MLAIRKQAGDDMAERDNAALTAAISKLAGVQR
jgi:hypothetical protein